MSWEERCVAWNAVRRQRGPAANDQIIAARKLLATGAENDWVWLKAALADEERKWFVAELYRFSPVPRRLLQSMVEAGVRERNPSANRYFIEPAVRSFGAEAVLDILLAYFLSGTNAEKAGAVSARYWVRFRDDEERGEASSRMTHCMFNEFIANDDIDVRRNIISQLPLAKGSYPDDWYALIKQVIRVARGSRDDYIRHRVEVQLGAGGPLMAIPRSPQT